ncbi:MAG: coenzyme F420-0:L-glutamate ligase [Eubacteriales bacterium]|nr:coenzyme F420-0:L-glutamate ligase [Eubacteriales bacterium]MDY3332505.1 coenzyme F420-0:L-glutamate ligase [Gallibacter sp.]
MERRIGTVVRGMRAPIIREGDNLEKMVTDVILGGQEAGEYTINDRDIIAMTESIVARVQGNYATVDQVAADIKNKFGGEEVGVIFPILSRNRFAICLRGISRGAKKVILMLSYPSDEVGNHLLDIDLLDEKGVNPYSDVLTQAEFEEKFGKSKHTFTGMDYVNYYKGIIEEEGAEAEIILANSPKAIVKFTKNVLVCDIHTRERTKRLVKAAGGEKVFGMDEILTTSVDGSGFNTKYGLLGSNKATEETIKLFPNDATALVEKIQANIKEATGKDVEVMVYGDGAFKDPVGKIWELADPVVSPGYTKGLEGTPNEIKLKYIADNDFAHLSGDELKAAVEEYIRNKDEDLGDSMVAQGTTPRRLTDLIGSLCDLTSGSGDKGTPIVFIQGYFDNYTK